MNTEFQHGDIILFELGENGDFLGKCIAYLTNSTVTHSAMIYEDNTMLEMTDSGISATPYHSEDHGYLIHVLRLNPAVDPKPVLEAGHKYLSQKINYDYCGILLLGGLLLFKKIKIDSLLCNTIYKILCLACLVLDEWYQILTQQSENKPMICSQLVYQCYCDCGPAYQIKLPDALLRDSGGTSKSLFDYVLLQPDSQELNWNAERTDTANSSFNINTLSEELLHQISRDTCDDLLNDPSLNDVSGHALAPVIKKAAEFKKKLEILLELSHIDVPLPSLFVTPADLLHAENLEHQGTVYVLLDDET